MKKTLPFSKTLVMEMVIKLADSLSVRKIVAASNAVPILDTYNYATYDKNMAPASRFDLGAVQGFVHISSFQKFVVEITSGQTVSQIQCNGQFLFVGAIDKVAVISGTEAIRLAVVCA